MLIKIINKPQTNIIITKINTFDFDFVQFFAYILLDFKRFQKVHTQTLYIFLCSQKSLYHLSY